MKFRYSGLLAGTLALFAGSAIAAEALKTPKQQISYVFGVRTANQLARQGLKLDEKAFNQAINDVWNGRKLKMSPEAMQVAWQQFQQERANRFQQMSEQNLKSGKAYREKNKKTKGVIELKSGVQYKILKKGKGKKPSPTDTVVVHYKGTLVNGKVFDSSYERKQPLTIAVNGVVRGWQEVLPMMPTGSKWNVVIPPELAYGPRGSGAIGPNATLIFDIELKSVK